MFVPLIHVRITIYAHLMGKTGSSEFENVQKIISPKQQQGRLGCCHPRVSNFLQGFEAEIFPVVMHIHLVSPVIGSFPPQKKSWAGRVESFFSGFFKTPKKKRTRRSVWKRLAFWWVCSSEAHGMFFPVFHHFRACPSCICANMPDSCRDPKHLPMPNTRHGSNQAVCLIIRFREG